MKGKSLKSQALRVLKSSQALSCHSGYFRPVTDLWGVPKSLNGDAPSLLTGGSDVIRWSPKAQEVTDALANDLEILTVHLGMLRRVSHLSI